MDTVSVVKTTKDFIFNLLYKLNIVKFNRLDDGKVKYLPCPFKKPLVVQTDLLLCSLDSELRRETHTHMEYYYKVQKDGSRKIVYIKEDEVKESLELLFKVDTCAVKYDGKVFFKPDLVINTLNPSPFKGGFNEGAKYTTKRYSTSKIFKLVHSFCLGVDLSEYETNIKIEKKEEKEVAYYEEKAREDFTRCLEKITLSDLEVKN